MLSGAAVTILRAPMPGVPRMWQQAIPVPRGRLDEIEADTPRRVWNRDARED